MNNSLEEKVFSCCGIKLKVVVESPYAKHMMGYLEEYFIEGKESQEQHCITVKIIHDSHKCEKWTYGRPPYQVEIFDNKFANQWRKENWILTKYSLSPSIWVASNGMDNTIYCIDPKESMPYVMRILRDVIANACYRKLWVCHGALCQYEGKGILIVGNKGSGKTTFLNYMLRAGAAFISNDRVYIKKEKDSFCGYGFPLPVNVGYGTINSMEEYRDYHNIGGGDKGKHSFSVKDVVTRFHTINPESCKIDIIVFPRIILSDDSQDSGRLNLSSVLDNNDYSNTDPKFRFDWVDPKTYKLQEMAPLKEVLGKVPMKRVQFRPGSMDYILEQIRL